MLGETRHPEVTKVFLPSSARSLRSVAPDEMGSPPDLSLKCSAAGGRRFIQALTVELG
jgi:hypothetical protein